MAVAAELNFGFRIPVSFSDRKWWRRIHAAGLLDVHTSGAMALFTIHVGGQVDDLLVLDRSGGHVAIHTFSHYFANMLLAK